MISDIQNPKISGLSTAHAYKYKTKQQAKLIKRRKIEMAFLLACYQSTYVREKHRNAYRQKTSEENRNVVLFCNTNKADKVLCSHYHYH